MTYWVSNKSWIGAETVHYKFIHRLYMLLYTVRRKYKLVSEVVEVRKVDYSKMGTIAKQQELVSRADVLQQEKEEQANIIEE